MTKIPVEYLTAEWTLDVVEKIFAAIDPAILAGLEKAVSKEQADQYRQVVIPHIDANVKANFANVLTPILNQTIEIYVSKYLEAAARMKGERSTVTKYDEQGRILEMIKTPLYPDLLQ